MELGWALQHCLCLTRARVGVVYGHRRRCGLDFFSSGELPLWLLALGSLFRGASDRTLSRLFDLHVLLHPDENVLHLGDIVLHQMLVEQVCDLQFTDECSGDCVFIVVVH